MKILGKIILGLFGFISALGLNLHAGKSDTSYYENTLKKMQQCAANPQADELCSSQYKWKWDNNHPYYLLCVIDKLYTTDKEKAFNDPRNERQEQFDRFNDAQQYIDAVAHEANNLQQIEENRSSYIHKCKSFIKTQYNKYTQKESPKKPVINKPPITTQLEKMCHTHGDKFYTHAGCAEVNKALFYTMYKPTNTELRKAREQNNMGMLALDHLFETRHDKYVHARELENGIMDYQIKDSFNYLRMANSMSEKEFDNAMVEFIEKLRELRKARE